MKSSQIVFASTLFLAASGAFGQGAATAAAGPTDPQIAHIVVTANAGRHRRRQAGGDARAPTRM